MSSENADFVQLLFDRFPETQESLRAGTFAVGSPLAEDIVWDASEI